jgi:hypothetical protein
MVLSLDKRSQAFVKRQSPDSHIDDGLRVGAVDGRQDFARDGIHDSIFSMTANDVNGVIAGQALAGVSAGISGIMYAVAPREDDPVNRSGVS